MTTAAATQPLATPRIEPSSQRRVLFDAARMVAAVAIVWLHAPQSAELIPSTAIGRFAVPFFAASVVLFVFESLARGQRRTFTQFASNRFLRLYVPFLAWTAVYLLFKLVKWILAPNQPNDFPGISAIVTGGFYHLWFLPFALVISLLAFAVGRSVIGKPATESRCALAAAALAALLATLPMPATLNRLGPCAEYWWMALPAALGGAAIGIAYRHGAARWMEQRVATLSGLAIAIAASAWTWHVGRSSPAENVAGLGFLLFALGKWDGIGVRKLAQLGPLAYGIYLSHLLFIKSCESVFAKLRLPTTPTLDIAVFAIAAVGSTTLAWLLSRSTQTRWLVA